MQLNRLLSLAVAAGLCTACANEPTTSAATDADNPKTMTYPTARTVEHYDEYHGERVADPYRWLEEIDSAETLAWIETQNKLASAHLESLPQREVFQQRLTALWNYEKFGVPERRGDRYFYTYNDGLKNQPQLLVQDRLDGEPRVLLDPNTLSADGTIALSGASITADGRLLAYGTSSGGSDWQEWRVRDVATGEDLPDHIQWVKFSTAEWNREGDGFWYGRYDAPEDGENALKSVNRFQKLYFHRLGTSQSQDALVYERPDQPDWGFNPTLSDDDRHLVINVWRGTEDKNLVFLKPLAPADAPVVELIPAFDNSYTYVGNEGNTYFFLTDDEAPRRRLIAIDITQPARANWREIIGETGDTLDSVARVGNRLVAEYLHDAASSVKLFDLDGSEAGSVQLPGIGTATGFPRDLDHDETFFAFTSFTQPAAIYRLDTGSNTSQPFRAPKLQFDPNAFETRQVFFNSKDGTRVPMFIIAKKGLRLDGSHPTIVYGYGGFNIPLTPSFSVPRLAWLEQGGVYASVNLRGGGEYGREWHEAGMKLHKQNVFDDMAAAAEYLIAQKYTSPAHLAINGGSNGGLLAAAVAMQRPDLFAASVPSVGVLDMLRFREFTIGWAWESDYGSVLNADEYRAIRAYSPLHNLKAGVNYPAFLITTGDHDDRVYPAHSFKFAATLQALMPERPALIRIETRAGHGAGKPTAKQIEESADVLGFIAGHTGLSTRAP